MSHNTLAVFTMTLLFGSTALVTSPILAGDKEVRAGGLCPHTSSSKVNNGGFTVALAPRFSSRDSTCLSSRIKVRAKNVPGHGSGWVTLTFKGDPGVFRTGTADKVAWTKHDVRIKQGNKYFWGGLTIRH